MMCSLWDINVQITHAKYKTYGFRINVFLLFHLYLILIQIQWHIQVEYDFIC